MVVLAGEILKEIKDHVEQGVSPQIIIKGLRRAGSMATNKVEEIAVTTDAGKQRETLRRLAATAMSSKLIHRNADFFTKSEFGCTRKKLGTLLTDQKWSSMPCSRLTKTTSTRSS